MKLYTVEFVDSPSYTTSLKVRAESFVSAVAKVTAKYPERPIRDMFLMDDEPEILD